MQKKSERKIDQMQPFSHLQFQSKSDNLILWIDRGIHPAAFCQKYSTSVMSAITTTIVYCKGRERVLLTAITQLLSAAVTATCRSLPLHYHISHLSISLSDCPITISPLISPWPTSLGVLLLVSEFCISLIGVRVDIFYSILVSSRPQFQSDRIFI